MPKIKTHKAIAKRFELTRRSKVLKRYAGQDHFNSRDPGKITRKKRRDQLMSRSYTKTIKQLLARG